ncbi:permease-like cell division protein FtsX [Endozoicomonas montiporae]|uniref:Cell division protein FtsX n=1 Tax=Endozoicomonas montiporae CL-33 TaxID=570277 RepID=A0A142BI24_9GAMM|nr:permease-like cell division protein FtsX [Endozoicomonas montiporae]AMO58400.1 cell division protein FtsX [Endozoicomonas montiporae CL-33]
MFPRKGRRNGSRSDSKARKPAKSPDIRQESDAERGAAKHEAGGFSFTYLKALHRQNAVESFRRLIQAPVSTLLNCLMIGVAFALPALMYLLIANLQVLGNGWEGNPRISVYLDADLNRSQIANIRAEIANDPDVDSIAYISPDEGLQEFQQKTDMQGVVNALGFNPLPGVIEVLPIPGLTYEEMDGLAERYQNVSGILESKLDREWVQRLQSIVDLLDQFALLLSLLLGITVILAIGNTVRLGIESRRDEIKVIKLVGGTDGFVMLPFLYAGVWYGLGGALLAYLVSWAVLLGLMSNVLELAGLYGSSFAPKGPGISVLLTLIFSGIVLGVAGAAVSCQRHIRNIDMT